MSVRRSSGRRFGGVIWAVSFGRSTAGNDVVAVEFLWWGVVVVGGVCKVIFMSNPTTVLKLCCIVLSLGL